MKQLKIVTMIDSRVEWQTFDTTAYLNIDPSGLITVIGGGGSILAVVVPDNIVAASFVETAKVEAQPSK